MRYLRKMTGVMNSSARGAAAPTLADYSGLERLIIP